MKFLETLNNSGFHFFDRIAFYSHPHMVELNSEYWQGHRRKRVMTIGKVSIWIRARE